MKKLTTWLFLLVLLQSCTSEEVFYDKELQLASEMAAIEAYLQDNNLAFNRHENDFYFKIEDTGNDERVEEDFYVRYHITIYDLYGNFYFSTDESVERSMGIRITGFGPELLRYNSPGWWVRLKPVSHLLPMLGVGGKAEFLVPSVNAYGLRGYQNSIGNSSGVRQIKIAPNTTLRVRMELISISEEI
ncbi:MAG: hypothetical protein Roseis2KO_13570 [Roseivirga sp.]